jgi:hypothetical protein
MQPLTKRTSKKFQKHEKFGEKFASCDVPVTKAMYTETESGAKEGGQRC